MKRYNVTIEYTAPYTTTVEVEADSEGEAHALAFERVDAVLRVPTGQVMGLHDKYTGGGVSFERGDTRLGVTACEELHD